MKNIEKIIRKWLINDDQVTGHKITAYNGIAEIIETEKKENWGFHLSKDYMVEKK